MGDADNSRASKVKGALGGLVGSLKRVVGGKKDAKEAAPRTGVSLRDRFSALEPSAVPTDAVPQNVSDDIPDPDGSKEVKVIHTSAARSSGSVRFSDRIGLASSSEAENGFERRISFDESSDNEDEEMTEACDDIAGKGVYGTDVRVVFEDDDTTDGDAADMMADGAPDVTDAVPAIDACETEIVTETIPETEEYADGEIEEIVTETAPETEEYADIADAGDTEETFTDIFTEPSAEETAVTAPTEERAQAAEIITEETADLPPKAETIPLNDDFDGGYDFLPRRGVSERFAGMERKAYVPQVKRETYAPQTAAPGTSQKAGTEAKSESTALAERMRARNTVQIPRKNSEIDVEGPTEHAGVSRTALLERITRERTSGRRVADLIQETERSDAKNGNAVTASEVDECDADVSAADIVHPAQETVAAEAAVAEEDVQHTEGACIQVCDAELADVVTEMNECTEAETTIEDTVIEDTVAQETAIEETVIQETIIEEAVAEEHGPEAIAVVSEEQEAPLMPETACAAADTAPAKIAGTAAEEITSEAIPLTDVIAEAEAEDVVAEAEENIIAAEETAELAAETDGDIAVEVFDPDSAPEAAAAECDTDHIVMETMPCADAACEAERKEESVDDGAVNAISEERPDSGRYLTEIENDVPCDEAGHAYDNAEEDMSALLNGVVTDAGVIPAEAVTVCAAEAAAEDVCAVEDTYVAENVPAAEEPTSEKIPEAPETTSETIPETAAGTAPGPDASDRDVQAQVSADDEICFDFSFLSEGTPSPSADIRFFWGQ
ncbi:MAG: hypothetical protein FWH44_04120 [Methanomassiliicoccaceae archaeon]|nr:hypothetical protein [Methanomassiliicoccaceae archaeon]